MQLVQDNQKSQENTAKTYSKKTALARCQNLEPDQAYKILEVDYGPGFAQWFADQLRLVA